MAFNPFDAFRKNAKPMMAALTIFVMIVFVLSTGGGGADFFDWIARLLGGADHRATALGSVEGTDYYSRDLQELRRRRAAANAFMSAASLQVDRKLSSEIQGDLQKNAVKDPDARALLEATQMYLMRPEIFQMPGINVDQLFPGQPKLAEVLRPLMGQPPGRAISELRGTVAAYMSRNKESEKGPEFLNMRRLSKVLGDHLRRLMTSETNMYFQLPNKSEEDALRFEMYLRLADKMAIKFINDDVKRLISAEMDGMLTPELAGEIDKAIRQNEFRDISSDQLVRAIGDEFRVMMANKVVEGSVYSGKEAYAFGLTPYEFFEFYKDRLAELTFQIVDVPVESFLAQVTENPTEKELDRFFRTYSKVEADPSRETPGFKEPRKVKLEYVVVDANRPIYREAVPALQAVSTIAGGYTGAFLGAGAIPGMMEVAAPLIAEPLLASEDRRSIEEMVKKPKPFAWTPHGFGPKPPAAELLLNLSDKTFGNTLFDLIGFRGIADAARQLLPTSEPLRVTPRDSSIYNPLAFASLVGQLVVPINPAANINLAMMGSRNIADLIETRDRVAFGMQMTLAPMSPAFYLGGGPVAAFGPALANLPAEPVGVFAAEKAAERRRAQIEWVAEKDLDSLVNKLNELHKNLEVDDGKKDDDSKSKARKLDQNKVDKANIESRAYVDNWLKNHPGVETGKIGPFDKFAFGEDPLVQNLLKEIRDRPEYSRIIENLFFSPRDTNFEANKFNTPLVLSKDYSKPVHALWKVDDREAKEYTSLDLVPPELRQQIIKAWKMDKARVKAKAAAEEFATSVQELAKKELQDADSPFAFSKGLADAAAAAKFKLLPEPVQIAKLKKPPQMQMPSQPLPYVGPAITNRDIKYPLGNNNPRMEQRPGDIMAEQMLELRNKPVGETIVIPNRPKDHFYVAVLTNKQDLDVDRFNSVFSKTNVPATEFRFRDALYQYALSDVVQKFQQDLQDRIKAEMKYKESEELKKQAKKELESSDQ